MNLLNRSIVLTLPLWLLADTSLAQGSVGCAPPGAQTPHLSVRHSPGGRVLRVENGPSLGRAYFLAEDHAFPSPGRARPAGPGCLAQARGAMMFSAQLDLQGVFETPLSPATFAARPTLSAVVVPQSAPWAQAALSNRVALGPFDGRAADPLGSVSEVVVITEFMKDPAAVGDGAGEWIELYNPGPGAVDIEGWVLSDLGSDSLALLNGGQGIVVPANDFLVLGKNDDPALNGGVQVDFVLSGTTLSNGDDEIILSLANGRVVDEVHYDDGTLWPDEAGRSASLELSAFDVVANDDPARWCNSSTPLVAGGSDTGTPGLANDPCSTGG